MKSKEKEKERNRRRGRNELRELKRQKKKDNCKERKEIHRKREGTLEYWKERDREIARVRETRA